MRNPINPKTGLPIPSRTDQEPRSKRQGRVPGPEDIRQVAAETLRDPGLHATPEEFGAGVARAVEDLGMKAAGIALAFDEKRRQAEDDTAGIAGIADARMRFPRVAQEMEARADKADGFTANLGPALAAETDAILRDLRDVRGLRHSQRAEDAIRTQLHMLASRMVTRGAKFEHGARLSQLGIEVDAAVRDLAMAAFNSPGDWPAIMEETESRLARFKDKLPPDILAAKVAAARGMIAANAAAGLIELDPALARQELKAGLFDDDLPAAERKRLRARAKAAVRDRRAQAERGQSRERAAAGADGARRLVVLEGAIGRGEAGEQAIAEAADILDNPTRVRLREKLDARRAEDAARNRRIETVSAVLAGRAPATGEGDGKPDGGGIKDGDLRPGAPGWRQAVDDHYASLADALETMDPDERARFEDDYAQATGVLPDVIAKTLRAGLLSADPAEQAAAATRLARLKEADPALIETIPTGQRRRAQVIAEFVDLGVTPERAVELAEKKRAGVGEDDQPAGSAGDDTPDKDVIENTVNGGTGEDTLEGGAGEPRQTPKVTPATIAEFFDDAAELEGQDFADAAIAAGMDPGRAALVRDIFRGTEDDRAALIERIGEQPPAFKADFKSLLGAIRAAGDDQEARRRILLTTRSLVRAESEGIMRDAEKLGEVLLGTRGRRGARIGAGVGGRAAPGLKVLMRHSKRFKNKKAVRGNP
ncbi:MAG: hypothetical protein IIC54_11620 [Proteobacteria bacterium]|nr:hypothetical protein [Pseudomonadota bacterium]